MFNQTIKQICLKFRQNCMKYRKMWSEAKTVCVANNFGLYASSRQLETAENTCLLQLKMTLRVVSVN